MEKAGTRSRNRVCISIVTKGSIRAETTQWLLRAFAQLAPDVEVDIVNDPRPLEHARNLQVHRFLATDCTHLFLLDSDCVPAERTVERLLALDLPIVTAPHLTEVKGEVGPMVVDRAPGGYRQHLPLEGLQKVDACGGSGLCIRREVLEKLGPPWFRFLMDEQGLLVKGEDFYFCERAYKAGYEVWADLDLIQEHIKDRRITVAQITRGD